MNANVNTGSRQFRLPRLGKVVTLSDGDAFERVIPFTQAYEGGESNDPADPGGHTKYGWTLATFLTLAPALADFDGDHLVDLEDFKLLTQERSVPLYRAVFWDRYGLGRVGGRATAVTFDAMVNTGQARGARFLQRAFNGLPLNMREAAMCLGLKEDGALGPVTLAAVMRACAAKAGMDAELARRALQFRHNYYSELPDSKFGRFKSGLINRVLDLAAFLEAAF